MMRSGRLLAEDSPDKLLAHYNLSSLEDVFLKLCINQGVNKGVEQLEIMANVSLSNETHQIVPRTQQQQAGDHDNLAFDYSVNEVDLPENDVQRRNRINSNESPVTPVDLSSVRKPPIAILDHVNSITWFFNIPFYIL
jgi:hypothetical protein